MWCHRSWLCERGDCSLIVFSLVNVLLLWKFYTNLWNKASSFKIGYIFLLISKTKHSWKQLPSTLRKSLALWCIKNLSMLSKNLNLPSIPLPICLDWPTSFNSVACAWSRWPKELVLFYRGPVQDAAFPFLFFLYLFVIHGSQFYLVQRHENKNMTRYWTQTWPKLNNILFFNIPDY